MLVLLDANVSSAFICSLFRIDISQKTLIGVSYYINVKQQTISFRGCESECL